MSGEVSAEARALEEVMNAFSYYSSFGKEKVLGMIKQMSKIPNDHQILIGGQFKEHINNIKERLEHNQQILKLIVNFGAGMFGEDHEKAIRIHQNRRPTNEFASKVLSTIRQICREWSSEGIPEREAVFRPIMEELERIYPKESSARHEIRILVPGCGLGRLAHDLIEEGFTVQGNEFSFFMLLTSCFILNACKNPQQYRIYPYILDKSNRWSYEDQLRPVTFPDKNLSASEQTSRPNSFSMCAGDFLEIVKGANFDVIITAWFIDTAHNIVEYIDAIYETLDAGGVWLNVGPLTWHYEDVRDETSIELPYSEIMRLIRLKGFDVTDERQIESKYTVDRRSMLQTQFTCAYFCARKK